MYEEKEIRDPSGLDRKARDGEQLGELCGGG
jgi:hypothetical protein